MNKLCATQRPLHLCVLSSVGTACCAPRKKFLIPIFACAFIQPWHINAVKKRRVPLMRKLFLSLILALAANGLQAVDTNVLSSVVIKQHIPATWLLDGPPSFRETILFATNGYCAIATSGAAGGIVATNQYQGSWKAKDSMVILTMTKSSDRTAKLPLVATNYIVSLTSKDLIVADASGLNLSHFRKLK